ncbi:MAG: hypothetical protein Q8R53_02260 [Nanoarchaeota archaeon]|nr:hypothetical protein [Nanoarchaeota archaeon]
MGEIFFSRIATKEPAERQLAWMERGFRTGRIVFARDELHERRS